MTAEKTRKLKWLETTCEIGHTVRIRPAAVAGNRAIFGSASDFCSYVPKGKTVECEKMVVGRKPIYEGDET